MYFPSLCSVDVTLRFPHTNHPAKPLTTNGQFKLILAFTKLAPAATEPNLHTSGRGRRGNGEAASKIQR